MNEYVYLYEMDSVNNSLGEMQAANERMYQVLVNEGDRLVLTYNQLGDSVLLGEWIQNTTMNDLMVEAIGNQRVVIAPFANIKSCVEYIQEKALRFSIDHYNAGDLEQEYIFSALPFLKARQGEDKPSTYDRYTRHVIHCHMLDALTRADVNLLSGLEQAGVRSEHVGALKKYVRFLLRVNLSGVQYLGNQKYQYTLYDCVQMFLQEVDVSPVARAFLEEAVTSKTKGRSEVLNTLEKRSFGADVDEAQVKQEAEAMVNFCYNWQLEQNIMAGGTALKGAFSVGELTPAFRQFQAFYQENGHIYESLPTGEVQA
ncbi:MAG: hypothetical protein LUG44_08785 [Clostridiales bacterium]|nr:hypothetical protein [Clostridiales bacterium]